MAAKVEPVCAEPKVFVGQLPDEASQADVQALFQQYGAISDCSLIKGPDGRGRGFAMVQFQKWRDAEAAIEHLNGTTSLGGNRTLVVKVADPPKRGGAAVGGIAPKKLFVGQVL
jgi:CUG-BP- and ETR3-like factor